MAKNNILFEDLGKRHEELLCLQLKPRTPYGCHVGSNKDYKDYIRLYKDYIGLFWQYIGLRDISPVTENQMDKKMEDERELGLCRVYRGNVV